MTSIDLPNVIYSDLKGRTVLISGGATGIGQSMVEAFARQGARTAFVDISAEAGEQLAEQLKSEDREVLFQPCDITDIRGYQRTIRKIADQFGPITALVNNAANDVRHKMDDITSERFDELLSINFKHCMFAAQAVAPMMRQAGGGSIINLGSISWMINISGFPVYSACKAGIHGMTRALARDLGPDRIRANTLVPGWVMTEKQLKLWVNDAVRDLIERNQCLPDKVQPEQVAQMALFLASDASCMCTAQNFVVDGGWS